MLAYLFWHRPEEGADTAAYEAAQERFHHSLAGRPPDGFRGSACLRAPELPWLAGGGSGGYEDWYLVDDWSALGVLRQAAVAAGHRSAHDSAARHAGGGAGGVYRLDEGEASLQAITGTIWVEPARDAPAQEPLALLLADGLRPGEGSLWRRELVLGPAPEYCLLAARAPAGVGDKRLPAGWRAIAQTREHVTGA